MLPSLKRVIQFVRSIMPTDPAQLLFLCGCIFVFISFQLRWWPAEVTGSVRHIGPTILFTSLMTLFLKPSTHGFRFTGGARRCCFCPEPPVCSFPCGREPGLCVAFSCSYGCLVSWLSLRSTAAIFTSPMSRHFPYSTTRSSSGHTMFHGLWRQCGNLVRDCISACSACSSFRFFSPAWRSA
jgi:hypothetical protein